MFRPIHGLVLALTLAVTSPVLAQERAPAERQVLLDLAYTLGESHALRQACEGAADQYWRDRMARLIEVEAADQGLTDQLQDRFNAGYNNRQAEFPTCGEDSRKALTAAAAKGQGLAAKMAVITHAVRPKPTDGPGADPPEPNATADPPR